MSNDTHPITLEERRERWIEQQAFRSKDEADLARLHYNAGAADALVHAAELRERARSGALPLTTRPVPLHTRSGA